MKRTICIFMSIVFSSFLFVTNPAKASAYQKNYFSETIKSAYKSADYMKNMGYTIEEMTISDLYNETIDGFEVQVTHMIADVTTTITEIVIRTKDKKTEFKDMNAEREFQLATLKGSANHTVCYVTADYEQSSDAYDAYTFDGGICYVLFTSHPFQLEGPVMETIKLKIGMVKRNSRKEITHSFSVSYPEKLYIFQMDYDPAYEPVAEEISIELLQIVQTVLQVADCFQYQKHTDDCKAYLEYGDPALPSAVPPDSIKINIYNKNELVKIIELEREKKSYIPVRYWIPIKIGE